MSKGSKQRPSQVPTKEVDNSWDNIFGKKDKPKEDCKKDCQNYSCKDNSEKNS